MKAFDKENSDRGFSIVELIIVIAIMAVLVGILTPTFVKYVTFIGNDSAIVFHKISHIFDVLSPQMTESMLIY